MPLWDPLEENGTPDERLCEGGCCCCCCGEGWAMGAIGGAETEDVLGIELGLGGSFGSEFAAVEKTSIDLSKCLW